MSNLIVIPADVTRQVLTWPLAIDAVRTAFESAANESASNYPVTVMQGTREAELFAVKAGIERNNALVGFKFGGYWPRNRELGIPPHSSTTVLLDSETGYPRALIGGSYANVYRTAAADAVAVASLARTDASILGVIGAGQQAEYEIRAISEVRSLSLIKIFSRSDTRGQEIARRLADLGLEIRLTDAEHAVRGSDIVVTVTPSTAPIVEIEWLADGVHVSAMGADTPGKQELATAIAAQARLFADHPPQSIAIGEFQHAFREGVISSADAICAIGLTTQGLAEGRSREEEITVFDSSGIATQDLTIAHAIVQRATELGLARTLAI